MLDKGKSPKSPQKGCVQGPWIYAELDDVNAALVQLVSARQITLPEELRWTRDSGTILPNGGVSGYTHYLRIQDARSEYTFNVRQFRRVGTQRGKVGLEQRAAAERTRDELAARAAALAEAESSRARAEEARARTREDAAAVRAELARALTSARRRSGAPRTPRPRRRGSPGGASGSRGGCTRTGARRRRVLGRRRRRRQRGGGDDCGDDDGLGFSDPDPSSESLLVLRATLQGHPVGHDLDVTAPLRARLRARGNKRLVIAAASAAAAEAEA